MRITQYFPTTFHREIPSRQNERLSWLPSDSVLTRIRRGNKRWKKWKFTYEVGGWDRKPQGTPSLTSRCHYDPLYVLKENKAVMGVNVTENVLAVDGKEITKPSNNCGYYRVAKGNKIKGGWDAKSLIIMTVK